MGINEISKSGMGFEEGIKQLEGLPQKAKAMVYKAEKDNFY